MSDNAKIQEGKPVITCRRCRDKGLEGGCPKCGKKLGKVVKRTIDSVAGDVLTENKVVINLIPNDFLNKLWKKDTLVADFRGVRDDKDFRDFTSELDNLHEIFISGKIPSVSGLIIAPRGYSKMTFVHSCMQLASQNGYKIFPLFDTQQMKIFLANTSEKPTSEFVKSLPYTYMDFLTADIVFLTVSRGQYRYGASSVIEDVIDQRSRMNRPTIVISSFGLKEIKRYDYDNVFDRIIPKTSKEVGLRRPVVITVTDKTMKGTV